VSSGGAYPGPPNPSIGRSIARLRRRWLLIGVVAMVLFSGMAGTVLGLRPQYQADGSLRVDGRQARIVGAEFLLSPLELDAETVQSEIQVLRSSDIASKVVARLGLQATEEFGHPQAPGLRERSVLAFRSALRNVWPSLDNVLPAPEERPTASATTLAVERLIATRTVEPAGRSRVILLGAVSRDPNRAADIVNTYIDVYLGQQIALKSAAARNSEAVLGRQIEVLQGEVRKADAAVESYRRSMGLYQFSDSSIVSRQLADLSDSLNKVTVARQEAEARVRELGAPLGGAVAAETLGNRLVQDLNVQESALQQREAELVTKFGPDHPAVAQVHAQLRNLEAKIRREVAKVGASLRVEVDVQRAKQAGLTEQVDWLQKKVAEYNDSSVQLRAMRQGADAARAQLEQSLKRQQEVRALATEPTSDGSLVSGARVPVTPSFPRTMPMLAVAAAASLGVAVLLALAIEGRNVAV